MEEIYKKKTEGTRIITKYEEGEKPSKYFSNHEKRRSIQRRRSIQSQITKLIVNNQEITHQNKIQNELLFFHETLFRNTSTNTSEDCERFLNKVSVPKLNYEDARICEVKLSELELLKGLKSMQNNKSSGNDGLIKEFCETF